MYDIVIYPLTTKRKGRIVKLLFSIITGVLIISFPFLYKSSPFSFWSYLFYITWGSSLILIKASLLFPFFYQRIYIRVNNNGFAYRTKLLSKEKAFLWKEISSIKFKENDILILDKTNLKQKITLKNITPRDKKIIKVAFRDHAKKQFKKTSNN